MTPSCKECRVVYTGAQWRSKNTSKKKKKINAEEIFPCNKLVQWTLSEKKYSTDYQVF